jgi:N-acetyl-anhydromuramyl-L-alanine amidase AmpD
MKLDTPIAIVLHHAASSRYATAQDIANVGISHHGIPDYHFIIDYMGNIHSVLAITEVAAHCGIDKWDLYQDESGVTNQNSIAICAIGNFEVEIMPEAQINAIVKCIRNIKIQYPKLFIKLHKELVNTACPGKNYPYERILELLKGTMNFKDVQTTRWSYQAIKKVYDLGIKKGDENGFRPLDKVTREEMAQIITNLLKYLGK